MNFPLHWYGPQNTVNSCLTYKLWLVSNDCDIPRRQQVQNPGSIKKWPRLYPFVLCANRLRVALKLVWGDWKNIYAFLPCLETETAHVIEIVPHRRQGPVYHTYSVHLNTNDLVIRGASATSAMIMTQSFCNTQMTALGELGELDDALRNDLPTYFVHLFPLGSLVFNNSRLWIFTQ